ncbi:MAG: alkaline phosphatase family protein [Deltaproteobacteria bacterium]|nr:alkaline phosphatase family protein [Deltaproteobacteria bacterium]
MKRMWAIGVVLGAMWIASAAQAAESKFIILGFDGMDPMLTEKFMAEGKMPNLKKLAEQGTYKKLITTTPSASPVAWSAFSVSGNPGKTGIYDFLRRMPGTYFPEFAMVSPSTKPLLPNDGTRYAISGVVGVVLAVLLFFLAKLATKSRAARAVIALVAGGVATGMTVFVFKTWVPKELPLPVLNRMGKTFWSVAGEAGINSTIIRVPVTFPAEDFPNGKLLSGLGVPDVRQTNGTFTVWETKRHNTTDTEMGGKLIQVQVVGNRVDTYLLGPKNFTVEGKPDVKLPFSVEIDAADKAATIHVGEQTQTVAEGEFSDFFTFDFKLNPIIGLQGIAKFALISTDPFKLYLAPVNFSPKKQPPTVRISTPKDFAAALAEDHGLYKTLGWQEETWALNENQIDETLFLADLKENFQQFEDILMDQIGQDDWRLFVWVTEATDRLQHMFWRYLDPKHPMYDEAQAEKFRGAFGELYHAVDTLIGKVMEQYVNDDTHLIILSDHGFQSFRKAVNINTWLVENGYMTLKGQEDVRDRNLDDLFDQGEFWPNVDWSRTKAYHLGLGQMYLNVFDREPNGIVPKEEYEALQEELRQKLMAFTDPEDGTPVFLGVYRRQDLYHGPAYDFAPDLFLGFNQGYRISWQSALGSVPKGLIVDNDRKWSGDHCSVDTSLTRGIFFSNLPINKDEPEIYDIAPTVLKTLGVAIPDDYDGKPLY